jgi:hypothetical protein
MNPCVYAVSIYLAVHCRPSQALGACYKILFCLVDLLLRVSVHLLSQCAVQVANPVITSGVARTIGTDLHLELV